MALWPHSFELATHQRAHIDRPSIEVYEYAANPTNLSERAPGLGISVELVDGRWTAESSMGRVGFNFVPRNEFGVLDHHVTLLSGQVVYNPLRVIPDLPGCEVMFTLRRQPEMSDEDFARDADAVAADLGTLKRVIEGR